MDIKELEFKKINAKNIQEYNKFYALRDNRTCDSVSLESFIWKDYYNVRAALVKKDGEDIGIIWLMGKEGEEFSALPVCATENLQYCFDLTKRYFNEVLGIKLNIHIADEEGVKELNLSDEEFEVVEGEDLKDYLYLGEKLRTLSGRKLHKKSNRYNKFVLEYSGRYEYRKLSCSDRDNIFKFLSKWREERGEEVEGHLDPEIEGIHSILENCKSLDVAMAGVYIDGNLEAFSIASFNKRHNMSIVHIEKANSKFNGLYQYINKEFQVNEFPTAYLVNREDDLGIEGLRKAKESYNPFDYARKYTIHQK